METWRQAVMNTLCPICEKLINLEVEYPNLEVVGHFLINHKQLMDKNKDDATYWLKYEMRN